MKNLFPLTTNKFDTKYHANLKSLKPCKSLRHTLDDMLFSMPLAFRADKCDTSSFTSIKHYIYKEIETRSMEEIADLCIALCEPYINYSPDATQKNDYNDDAALYLLKGFIPGNDKATHFSYLKEIAATFIPETFSTQFKQALKDFLILSLSYTFSLSNPNSLSIPSIVETLKIGTKKEGTIFSRIGEVKSKFRDKHNYSDFDASSAQYLEELLSYQKNDKNEDHLNRKKNYTNLVQLTWDSWYDVPLMLGLIKSSSVKLNPFISIPASDLYEIDLEKFLALFDLSSQFDMREDLDTLLKRIINSPSGKSMNIERNKFYVFYQVLLERITNINLINKCHDLNAQSKLPPCYELLASYPLVNFRLTFLDAYVEKYSFLKSTAPDKAEAMTELFHDIVRHHIFCTFPILHMLFHTFILFKLKGNTYINGTDQYFEKLNSTLNLFPNMPNMITPQIPFAKKPETSDKTDTEYKEIYNKIFNDFMSKMQNSCAFDFQKEFDLNKYMIFNTASFLSSFKNTYNTFWKREYFQKKQFEKP